MPRKTKQHQYKTNTWIEKTTPTKNTWIDTQKTTAKNTWIEKTTPAKNTWIDTQKTPAKNTWRDNKHQQRIPG